MGPDQTLEVLNDRRLNELDSLFEDAPCGYMVFNEHGVISRANRTLLRLIDAERSEIVGTRLPLLFGVGSRLFYETHLHPLLIVNGEVSEVALDLRGKGGDQIPVLLSVVEAGTDTALPAKNQHASEHTDAKPERSFRAMLIDVTERRRIEDDLRAARRLAERRAQRLAALQHVSSRLSVAVSPDDVAAAVATSARAVLDVDSIVLWRLEADGRELHPISRAGPAARSPLAVSSFDRSAVRPHWEAIDTGAMVTLTAESDHYGPTVEVMLGAGHRLVHFIPFQIGSAPGGVVSMGFTDADELDPDDEAILTEVVAQAAAALERADLYAIQRDIALTWQGSLMAHDIPDDERIKIRSHYAPATMTFRVGGDWYDVVRLDDDRFGFIIGDVVGHGMGAAAAMGQLRSAGTALAQSGLDPTAVLEGLDRFAATTPGTRCATVLCGDLDLTSGVVRMARAGHVPPVWVSAGHARFIEEGGGPPLAVALGRRPAPAEIELIVDDRLVLYTDGLIERRGETLDDGMDRLSAVLDGAGQRSIVELVTASATDEHDDDICVLELTRFA